MRRRGFTKLCGGFRECDVRAALPAHAAVKQELQRKRRLAGAGVAVDQIDMIGREAAAEDRIKASNASLARDHLAGCRRRHCRYSRLVWHSFGHVAASLGTQVSTATGMRDRFFSSSLRPHTRRVGLHWRWERRPETRRSLRLRGDLFPEKECVEDHAE